MAIRIATPCNGGLPIAVDFVNFSAVTSSDFLFITFTGSTTSGCYDIGNTIATTPFDGAASIITFTSCTACQVATTPTPTPTVTQTPTPTQTPGYIVQFQDCGNSSNVFRFSDPNLVTPVSGQTYFISGSTGFQGCATIVTNTNSGPIYDGSSVVFTEQDGCGDTLCPTVSERSALLRKCSDNTILYCKVNEDTAFIGATYLYNGECYGFIEFSGPGGPSLGDPDFADCNSCSNTPTPTPTPNPTPSFTPTPSVTPPSCPYNEFCFYTSLSSLSGYSGNYSAYGTYNGRVVYSGDGTTYGVIYFNTGINAWVLSNSTGGTPILQGSTNCYSSCPDISANDFTSTICPTPTSTPPSCNDFDFSAYFNCEYYPTPTPTVSISCDVVNFDVTAVYATPTPTPTFTGCTLVGLDFTMSAFTPSLTPTFTLSPTLTPSKTVAIGGKVTYEMLDEAFNCGTAKLLVECGTNNVYYVSENLSFNGIQIVKGITFLALINGQYKCLQYVDDVTNISSNSIITTIQQIYNSCEYCQVLSTPTPTPTSTTVPGPTQTPTPSNTATPSMTQSIGATPAPTSTPTSTNTLPVSPTPSNTLPLTPTPSPNYVYVYQSCTNLGNQTKPTQVIQTIKVSIPDNRVFKDEFGNCWSFVGRFDKNYIPPTTVISITYSGNYFVNADLIDTFDDCTTCLLPPLLNYYELSGCETGPDGSTYKAYSLLQPSQVGQRYVLPSFPPIFYTWTGAINQSRTKPSLYNGSIQITTFINCP